MTLDEYKARAKADLDNAFEKGKSQGSDAQIILDRMRILDGQWQQAAFPEGFNFVMEFKNKPNTLNALLMLATGVKTATLICKAEGTIVYNQMVRSSTVEVLDLTNFKPTPTQINWFALGASKLVSVFGEIDMTNCTSTTGAFNTTTALEEIRFKEGTIGISIQLNNCNNLTAESLHSILMGLSPTVTGQTLTLPIYEICKATYDAKYGEGAWDILAASKTNWTIAYS